MGHAVTAASPFGITIPGGPPIPIGAVGRCTTASAFGLFCSGVTMTELQKLAAYHGPRLAARMAQAVEEHRAAKIRITSQHDFKPGEVVTISGGTGWMAEFNGTHVIGGGSDA